MLADPAYTALVVGGLAIAFASVMLFVVYASAVLGGDADVPDAQQVVRLESLTRAPGAAKGWIADSTMMFQDRWPDTGAPVADSSRYLEREMSLRVGARVLSQRVSFVDPGIATVFGLRALHGDIGDALARPDSLVISAELARRLFGSAAAVGQGLQIGGMTMTVRAVVPDRPVGSAISTDLMASILSPVMPARAGLDSWLSIRGTNYVRLLPGATPQQLSARAQARFEDTPEYRQMSTVYGKFAEFRAVPLGDLALAGAGSASTRAMLIGLGIACGAITLLAAINYVNLGTLRVLARQREIGIRKAFGATPARIGALFIFESVSVAVQACLAGIAAVWWAAPILGEWVGRPLAWRGLDPLLIMLALLFSVVLGLAVGARPAWVAHRLSCSLALAGRGDGEGSRVSWTRRALTVLQFGAAMALVAITLVMLRQASFLRQADPGFDMARIVTIDAPVDMRDRRLLALRDEISHLPGVRTVGLAWDVPGRGRRYATTDVGGGDGRSLQMAVFVVGPGFFESYGLASLAGRVFSEDQDKWGARGRIVVNASAAKLMGFASAADAVGRKVLVGRGQVGREHTAEIIGVVPDIRHRSLREPAGAVLYSIHVPLGIDVVSVQAADPIAARRAIEAVWPRHFPDDLPRIATAQHRLESLYEADVHLGALIGAGGAIALCLAVFGLSALTAHTVRRRTPEIVLRKLQGARPLDIAGLLARELSLLVAAGALLGLPVALWFQETYLADFVVRAPAIGWSPAIAFACTAAVAALAAARHTMRAASISPAQALRGSAT